MGPGPHNNERMWGYKLQTTLWVGWDKKLEVRICFPLCQTEYHFVKKKAEVCGPKQVEK